jgi:hypothetical protein
MWLDGEVDREVCILGAEEGLETVRVAFGFSGHHDARLGGWAGVEGLVLVLAGELESVFGFHVKAASWNVELEGEGRLVGIAI